MNRALSLLFGLLITFWIAAPAWADNGDSIMWLKGDYVGVGGINIDKFSKTPLYNELMNFFKTSQEVEIAFQVMSDSGLVPEKILNRIVVGIPSDVEKSEHLVFWETTENLDKYKELLQSRPEFDIRKYEGIEYFATKRTNECLFITGKVLVLGSELKIKEIIESVKSNYNKGPKRQSLQKELKRTDKSHDAWFAYALTTSEQERLGRGDPIVDMSASDLGKLNLGQIKSGNLSLDFSSGLRANAMIQMNSVETAAQTANLLMALLQEGTTDEYVRSIGMESFLTGISFSAQKSDIRMNVNYDQEKFVKLITLVTQFAKSIQAH